MSDTDYLVWFVATAAMTVAVLAIGTMIAAEILPLGRRRASEERAEQDIGEPAETTAADDGPAVAAADVRRRAA